MVDRDHVLLEKGGNGARVWLNRPRTNAVAVELLHRLEEIEEVDDDPLSEDSKLCNACAGCSSCMTAAPSRRWWRKARAVKASTFSGLTTDEFSRLQLSLAAPA